MREIDKAKDKPAEPKGDLVLNKMKTINGNLVLDKIKTINENCKDKYEDNIKQCTIYINESEKASSGQRLQALKTC